MTDRIPLDHLTSDQLDALYDQREEAVRYANDQRKRADQVEDLLRIAHETSNRSEAERARAVERAEAAERDAGIYNNRLTRLSEGYAEQMHRLEAAEAATARVRHLCELTIAHSVRVQAIDQARDTLAALDGPAPAICELPHQTIAEEDECEQRRLAALTEPKEG